MRCVDGAVCAGFCTTNTTEARAAQDPLSKICIPDDSDDYAEYAPPPDGQSPPVPVPGDVARRLLLLTVRTVARRALLAEESTSSCPPGQKSLWPVSLQHSVHYLVRGLCPARGRSGGGGHGGHANLRCA